MREAAEERPADCSPHEKATELSVPAFLVEYGVVGFAIFASIVIGLTALKKIHSHEEACEQIRLDSTREAAVMSTSMTQVVSEVGKVAGSVQAIASEFRESRSRTHERINALERDVAVIKDRGSHAADRS